MATPPDHDPKELVAAVLALCVAGGFDAADRLADLAKGGDADFSEEPAP